jgi:NTE family protein
MDKNTLSKTLPTIALRDHVAPDTPLSERPPVPKSLAASKNWNLRARLPSDRVVLLLQGGGALGSYQAGFYEALSPRRPLLVRNQVGRSKARATAS